VADVPTVKRMPRQRMTTADRDPVERLHALRTSPTRRIGWVPGPAGRPDDGAHDDGADDGAHDDGAHDDGGDDGAHDGADGLADDADDWHDAHWSADDVLTFGAPDDDVEVVDEAGHRGVGSADADPRPADPAVAGRAAPAAFRARRVRARPWERLAEAWVPEPLRDARVDPGRRGALALTLVAALAAVAAAIGVWRDRPEPRPVQPVASAPLTDTISAEPPGGPLGARRPGNGASAATSLAIGSATGRSAAGGPDAHASASVGPAIIAVSVTGLVRTPGLIRLPAGSRVADAIAAVGGVTGEGTITGLNLAAALSDGDSVVVGAAPRTPGPGSGPDRSNNATAAATAAGAPLPGTPVNLNTADAATLENLPGVGPVMAANIVAWREQNGSFGSVEQLQEVTGIGPARYAQLAPLVVVR